MRIARRFGVSELTIGLTIVAMGTSTPELVVTVDAALAGLGEIGVGNVVGSNAYNLAFILGAVSLLRVIPVERSLVHRDGVALVLSTLAGVAVLFDRTVTAVEGALLIGAFAAYTLYLIRGEATAHSIETEYTDSRITGAVPARLSHRVRDALLLVGGLALVLVSGHFMVEAASSLARGVGVSDWAIGLLRIFG